MAGDARSGRARPARIGGEVTALPLGEELAEDPLFSRIRDGGSYMEDWI